jgi:hypothetical protein
MLENSDLQAPIRYLSSSGVSHVTSPADPRDERAWIEILNQAWHEKEFALAERVSRILMILSPEKHDFANTLQRVRSQLGVFDSWPSPRTTAHLAPRDGRSILFKRWFDALRLFRDGDIDRSIPMLRKIAKALPEESPFAFGMNLRDEQQTTALLASIEPNDDVWNPVGDIINEHRPFTFLVSCNQNYMDQYGPDFLSSISDKCPGAHVHLHYCDPRTPPEAQLGTARANHPGLRITASWSLSENQPRPTYFACARYLVAPHLLKQTMSPVLIVDIDATLRREPGEHLAILRGMDVGLSITEGGNHWNTVKAGTFWVTPTDAGMRFSIGLARYLHAALVSTECCWTLDQTALWAAYEYYEHAMPDAKFLNLYKATSSTGREINLVEELFVQIFASRKRIVDRKRGRSRGALKIDSVPVGTAKQTKDPT